MIEWIQTCFICTSVCVCVCIYIYIYVGWAKSRYTIILYYILYTLYIHACICTYMYRHIHMREEAVCDWLCSLCLTHAV
jgi:hypothetical protein